MKVRSFRHAFIVFLFVQLLCLTANAQQKAIGSKRDSSFFSCHCPGTSFYDFTGKVIYTDTLLAGKPGVKIQLIQWDVLPYEFPIGIWHFGRDNQFSKYVSKQGSKLVHFFPADWVQIADQWAPSRLEEVLAGDFYTKRPDTTHLFYPDGLLRMTVTRRREKAKGHILRVIYSSSKGFHPHIPAILSIDFSETQGIVFYRYYDIYLIFDCKLLEPVFAWQQQLNTINHLAGWK